MSGEKETPKKTTNDAIKGPSVVTSTYDWLNPEKMETQLTSTQNYLKAKSEDFTPFDAKKGNANLAIQARYKAYKDKLDKALQEKDSKKYAQLYDKVSKVANVLEKNKLAEAYGLENPDFYVDQKTVLGKDFDDYVKVRNYVGEMYGYKNLGIDVEKDKHGSRMSVQDVTPRQSTRASQFINTGTRTTESNETREESFDQDITYNPDTKTYGIRFTNPKVQERIETRLRPNPTEQGVGFKGMKEGKGTEFQDAAKAKQLEKEAKAFKQATNSSIVTELPKKSLGTDNTVPTQQGVSAEQYGSLAVGTAQIAGGIVEATDKQKNGKKSVGGAALSGAASGAAMGTAIAPGWGTVVGGAIGGTVSAVSASIGNKKIDKQVAAQAARDAEARNLAMFQPMKNTQANMYAKGTSAAATTKLVEVEKDEVVLRKGTDGSFTKVADFKGGKTHEQGGEPYLLKAGDVIFPGKKRDVINKHLAKNDIASIDKERQKLPKEVGAKAEYGIDAITGLPVNKTFGWEPPVGTGTVLRPTEQTKPTIAQVPVKPNTVKPVLPDYTPSFTAMTPKGFDNKTISAAAAKSITAGNIKDKQARTAGFSGGLRQSSLKDVSNSATDKTNIAQNILPFVAPVTDIISSFQKPEKVNRRYSTAEELSFNDHISAGLRQEASIADRVRRGNTSTSAQQNRANAAISSAMKSKDMQNIGASESARRDQIAAMNANIRTATKDKNLELANRYDEQDTLNKNFLEELGRKGARGITDVAQSQLRDKAMEKHDLNIVKLLATEDRAFDPKTGFYYRKDAKGNIIKDGTR